MEIHGPRFTTRLSPSGASSQQHAAPPLLRLSVKRLGGIATRAYNDVRDYIAKETAAVTSPTPTIQLPTQVNDAISRLKNLIKRSREVLARANTVILPNNLFPDTVTVDRTRITIVQRTFFWSSDVISIGIDDILNVSTSCGPLFGSLTISSRVMNSTDHYKINYFWRKDAVYLKHIIQGYVVAKHNDILIDDLTKEQLIETLLELGGDE
ncbi:MAG: hypothetical protein ACHQTE_02725 [Candidatus Saccharimonadales bacterium]